MTTDLLLAQFDMVASAPGGIDRLRQLILQLAVRGRLVAQNSEDEPASVLLARARAAKTRIQASTKGQAASGVNPPLAPLPPTWAWTTLAELGLVNPRNDVPDDQEVAFVPMTLVPQGYGEPVRSEVRLWREVKKGFTHFAEGDIVLAKITPCFQNGKAAVMRGLQNGVGAGTTELHVFRPIADTVLPEYVYLYLKSPNFVDEGIPRMTGTAGQKRVPGDYFAQNPFSLPPLAEQRRIVERVDALMALCDALEERQAQAGEERRRLLGALVDALLAARDAGEAAAAWARLSESFDLVLAAPEDVAPLRQAVLQLAVQGRLVEQNPEDEPASKLQEDVIRKQQAGLYDQLPSVETSELSFFLPKGWALLRLGHISNVVRGGSPRPAGDKTYYDGSIPFLKVADLTATDDIFLTTHTYTIKEAGLNKTRFVHPNTLMLTNSGATLGIPKICTFATTFNDGIAAFLEISSGVDQVYLYYFLKSKSRWFLQEAARGQGQPNLNTDIIKRTIIAVPPLAEQHRIVVRVEQLMGLCDALEARLREERAAAERLADVLCAAVAAGQPGERPQVPADVMVPAEGARILELPRRGPALDHDAYAIFAARVIQQHQGTPTARTLGRVKLEKIAHLAEPYGGVDLGRTPRAMPRGPADFDRLVQVIERGRELNAFDAPAREDAAWGYQFVALPELGALAGRFDEVFGARAARLDQLIALLVPLKSRQGEAVATLYAVWNDMLRAGLQPDDEQIFGAFCAFHPRKERFRPEVLVRWLGWMREHGVVPDGSAKPTLRGTQESNSAEPIDFAAAAAHHASPARRVAETPAAYSSSDEYEAAVALLAERGTLVNGDVQAVLGVDAATARALLKRLVAEGLARQEGERRAARYIATGIDEGQGRLPGFETLIDEQR